MGGRGWGVTVQPMRFSAASHESSNKTYISFLPGTACKNNTHTHTHTTIETDQSARAASFSVVGGTSFAVTTASTAATVLSGGTLKPNASMANCFVFLHA